MPPRCGTVLVIGADGMEAELREARLEVDDGGARPSAVDPGGPLERAYDAVIVGLDPTVDYARLSIAMAAVAGGARLIATNADARYPTPAGFLPARARSSRPSRRRPA